MISIRDAIHKYAASLEKAFKHDRSTTVGASEVGQCARKTWFSKNHAPRDPDYADGFGARLRGDLIENHLWLPALRANLPEGASLLYAGDEQRTFVDEYLSATTDGLLVWPDGRCVNLDCKSIDPRATLRGAKPEHVFQVQAQMGILRKRTEYKPEVSVLSYVNASFVDDVTEFAVPWDPRMYIAAKGRARDIMKAIDPMELLPEGKIAGGGECRYCDWASHCDATSVARVPEAGNSLDRESVECLRELRDAERELAAAKDEAAQEHGRAVESIKQFLRENGSRGFKGEGWGVSYSVVAGRMTLDTQAVEAAGIDLSPYTKTGKPSERLTIR